MQHKMHQENKADRQKQQAIFLSEVDKDLLKVKDDHELKMLIQLLMRTSFRRLPKPIANQRLIQTDPAEAIADFNSKVRWLREGAKKKGNYD